MKSNKLVSRLLFWLQIWFAILLFLFLVSSCHAEPCVRYPKGKVPATHVLPLCTEVPQGPTPMERIVVIRKTLPIPADWHFLVVDEVQWNHIIQKSGTRYLSESAVSNLDRHFTFIREGYAIAATDYELRRSLAHEMGHRMCDCQDEDKANFYRDQMLK